MVDFIKKIEMSLKKNVCQIKSDNGSEFKNKMLDSLLTEKEFRIISHHHIHHNKMVLLKEEIGLYAKLQGQCSHMRIDLNIFEQKPYPLHALLRIVL